MERKPTRDLNRTECCRKYSTSSEGAVESTSGTRCLKDLQCQQNGIKHGRSLDSVRAGENATLKNDTGDSYVKRDSDNLTVVAKKRKRRLVRKHVVGVVRDLSNVLFEINSVTSELKGVLNQIERVTTHIEQTATRAKNVSENDISSLKTPISAETQKQFPPRSASCYALSSSYLSDARIASTLNERKMLIKGSTNARLGYEGPQSACSDQVLRIPVVDKANVCKTLSLDSHQRCRRPVTGRRSSAGPNTLSNCRENNSKLVSGANTSMYSPACTRPSSQRPLHRPTDLNCSYKTAVVSRLRTRPQLVKHSKVSKSEIDSQVSMVKDRQNIRCIRQHSDEISNSVSIENTFRTSDMCEQEELHDSTKLGDSSPRLSLRQNRLYHDRCSRSKSMPLNLSKGVSRNEDDEILSDFRADYDRDINTWTTFAMVHIDGDEQDL